MSYLEVVSHSINKCLSQSLTLSFFVFFSLIIFISSIPIFAVRQFESSQECALTQITAIVYATLL